MYANAEVLNVVGLATGKRGKICIFAHTVKNLFF
jgi:hypothetical protein